MSAQLRDRLIARRATIQSQIEQTQRRNTVLALDRAEFLSVLETWQRDCDDAIAALAVFVPTCSRKTVHPRGFVVGCEHPQGHDGRHIALAGDEAEYEWGAR